MARKLTVLKKHRQEEKKRRYNRANKSAIKRAVKDTKKAILNQDENSLELMKKSVKLIDKASAKGIIHKNTAARKKSRLAKYKNKFGVKT